MRGMPDIGLPEQHIDAANARRCAQYAEQCKAGA